VIYHIGNFTRNIFDPYKFSSTHHRSQDIREKLIFGAFGGHSALSTGGGAEFLIRCFGHLHEHILSQKPFLRQNVGFGLYYMSRVVEISGLDWTFVVLQCINRMPLFNFFSWRSHKIYTAVLCKTVLSDILRILRKTKMYV